MAPTEGANWGSQSDIPSGPNEGLIYRKILSGTNADVEPATVQSSSIENQECCAWSAQFLYKMFGEYLDALTEYATILTRTQQLGKDSMNISNNANNLPASEPVQERIPAGLNWYAESSIMEPGVILPFFIRFPYKILESL